MTKRAFPIPMLAAIFLALLSTTAFAQQFFVTFNYFGGTDGTSATSKQIEITAETGGKIKNIGDLPTLTMQHHIFLGWRRESRPIIENIAAETFNNGENIFADWDKTSFFITIEYDGGTDGTSATSKQVEITAKTDGTIKNIGDLPTLTRQHHTFLGWVRDDISTPVPLPTAALSTIKFGDTNPIFARWAKTSFFIIASYDGGTKQVEITAATGGTIKNLGDLSTITKIDHTLVGWIKHPIGIHIANIAAETFNDGEHIDPIWELTTFRITADYNGGTDGSSSAFTRVVISQYSDGTITGALPTLTRACYNQNGWALSNGGAKISDIATETFNHGATIYAIWSQVHYSHFCYEIKFKAMGGAFGAGATASTEITVGTKENKTVALPANPKRTGYTFKEWNLENGTKVTAATVFSANMDVYAIWTQNASPVIAAAAKSFSIALNGQDLQILGIFKAMPVSIYNLQGKLMLTHTAKPNESISVARLPKGVYIARAGAQTVKFVK